MTMRELARLANVSVSTVSKAFHEAEDVSEDTRKRIFDLARQHGCYGKFYKGKYPKQIIAIICPELGSNFYTAYVERLQKLIEDHNGIALVSAFHFDTNVQEELVEYYASYLQVDGILVFGLSSPLKKGYDIPIVSLLAHANTTVDAVHVDIKAPILEAVSLLHSLGHRKIAFIGEELTVGKETFFIEAINEIPSAQGLVIQSHYRFEQAGEDGVQQLLKQYDDYTALVCAYDDIAIGAIRQLKRKGLEIPQDISVVGIDNIHFSEYTETSLTTIDTNPDEVCLIAWDLLQKKQQNKYYKSYQTITITGKLVIRETIGPVKHLNYRI